MSDALPADGLYTDLSHAQYLDYEAFSASGAKKLLRSPAHYLVERSLHRTPTAAMQFGTLVHMGVLEPQLLDAHVCVIPAEAPSRPTSRTINAKKPGPAALEALQWWSEFDATHQGMIYLSAEDFVHLHCTIGAIRQHPGALRLLDGDTKQVGQREVSMFWTDPEHHVSCKARADYLRSDFSIVDIKTTQDASHDKFARDAAGFLYHIQAAHYLAGIETMIRSGFVDDSNPSSPTPFFGIIAAEKEPPYGVAAYVVPTNAVAAGERLRQQALQTYRTATESGVFGGYPDLILPLEFPRWATTFNN